MPGSKPPDHPITSAASVRRMYWLLLAKPRFRRAYLRLCMTIFRTYIRPQFFQGRGHRKIQLDTELDARLPFDPTWLPCYLGFVRLWEGSLGWLHIRFGDRALPELEGFVQGMESLFLAARGVFAELDSTVASRPGFWPPGPWPSGPGRGGRPARLDWLLIQCFDRNSFCFPSLHVMIVRYNAARIEAGLDRLRSPGEDFSAEKAFLEERALRIVESIVHVKQHGLSDIPAGLFLLRNMNVTGGFPAGAAGDDMLFLERLFPGPGDREGELRAFLQALYARLQKTHAAGSGTPQRVLLGFLKDYREEVGKLLA